MENDFVIHLLSGLFAMAQARRTVMPAGAVRRTDDECDPAVDSHERGTYQNDVLLWLGKSDEEETALERHTGHISDTI
jgi:hypothetical protein